MNARWLTFAGLLATATASFFLGRSTAPPANPDDGPAIATGTAKLSRERTPPRATAAGREGGSRIRPAAGESHEEAIQRRISDLLESPDAIARAESWLAFLDGLDGAELESAVDAFRDLGLQDSRASEYRMILTAWAKLDPYAALDYAKENTGGPFARNTILETWASSDPEGAIAWAESNHEGDDANPWMIGVIRGLAPDDPARATELMAAMPYSERRGEALGAILPRILRDGPEATKSWVASIDDSRLQGGVIRRAAGELAKDDPRGTADWVVNQHPEHAGGVIDDVIGGWLRESEGEALAYYQSLPSGDIRSSALRGITNSMATQDPRAAADFLDRHAADATDRTYNQFVWHSFRGDPELAVSYIDPIQDSGARSSTYRRTLEYWMRQDFDAATQWIDSNPLPDDVAQRVRSRREQLQGERR